MDLFNINRIEDLVLSKEDLFFLKEYTNGKIKKNLILHGLPGNGKTTIANLILSELIKKKICSQEEILFINSSLEGNISFFKTVVQPFCSTTSEKKKFILIDECEALSSDCFFFFRTLLDAYSNTCFFVFICNTLSKIPPQIYSRSVIKKIGPFSEQKIGEWIIKKLKKNGIKIDITEVKNIISKYSKDIRFILSQIDLLLNNNIKIKKQVLSSAFLKKMFETLTKENFFVFCKQIVSTDFSKEDVTIFLKNFISELDFQNFNQEEKEKLLICCTEINQIIAFNGDPAISILILFLEKYNMFVK